MIDDADRKTDTNVLSEQGLNLKQNINEHLIYVIRNEENKCYERVNTKELLGGDNTQYIHLVASGKRRKQRILKLK